MHDHIGSKKNQPPASEKKIRPLLGEQTSRILEPSPQGLISSSKNSTFQKGHILKNLAEQLQIYSFLWNAEP